MTTTTRRRACAHTVRVACFCFAVSLAATTASAATLVRVQTVLGEFFITLTPERSPSTVANFLNYVRRGDYDSSFFHRSVPGFIVQGGGFAWRDPNAGPSAIDTDPAVTNEFNVTNARGTVAMAKLGSNPNSATSQWFVNLADNGTNLDNQNGGFTVFGTVDATGMRVVDEIARLPRANAGSPFNELPVVGFSGGTIFRDNVVLVTSTTAFETTTAPLTAVLPGSRAVPVDATATGFTSVVNPSGNALASCRLRPVTAIAGTFTYRATDPATNEAVGLNDPRFDVAAGSTATFVFAITPSAPFDTLSIELDVDCGNAPGTAPLPGVNTFDLSATDGPAPDVIALAATPGNTGITELPDSAGSSAFSVASINVGSAGTVVVSADTGGAELPIDVFLCATDPATAQCNAAPASAVTQSVANLEASTFSVFVTGRGAVAFDPAANRVFVRFQSESGAGRGSTSVAVRTAGN